ncbi:MAG: homocysteine S-methyltransferase [Oscillospiraceae bacterium]|nr:homocysteine S-methyltransferase [Oscillospiraceae bacterium]
MIRHHLEDLLNESPRIVIDGSMSTLLEELGLNLNHKLWTALALSEHSELVEEVHKRYFRSGADCGITCSYQATIPGLMESGYSREQAEQIIENSVKLFLNARDEWWREEGEAQGRSYPLCLGACGPYGAYLADGSEYRGNYGVSDDVLRDFHYRREQILWNAGADLLLFETMPSLNEVKICAEIAEELGADYWISFSCKDGEHINEGDRIEDCARSLSSGYPHLRMIGVNCSKPEYIESLIRELKKATDLPIGVYPNSGDEYDPKRKCWCKREGAVPFGDLASAYYEAGASAVGGCCTTVERHIREVTSARERFLQRIRVV